MRRTFHIISCWSDKRESTSRQCGIPIIWTEYGPNTEEWDGAKKTSTVCNKQLQKHEQHLVHAWDTAMGVTRVRSTIKAEILNQQFQSVYTKENLTKIPEIAHSKIPSMKLLIISTLSVTKLLENLKPHRASGSDNILTSDHGSRGNRPNAHHYIPNLSGHSYSSFQLEWGSDNTTLQERPS